MKNWTLIAALALLPGCGESAGGEEGESGGETSAETTNTPTTGGGEEDETQVPPTTGTKVTMRAWLDAGHYKMWKCEAAGHDPLPISPHGKNRICSNAVLSAHGDGEYPVDSAAVKELLADDGTTIIGYAVYRHVKAGTDGGSWYWYEDVPLDSPAPHDDDGVVADGLGDAGPEKDICVGCHVAAGMDEAHPGHDFVYVQVK